MNALLKRTGILIIALAGAGCAERGITDASQAKLKNTAPSADALPGADVIVNFEALEYPPWYYVGPIDTQDDWTSTGAAGGGCGVLLDHAVVSNVAQSYSYTSFGLQSLRLSNAFTTGCFGDQTFSKRLSSGATGESDAEGTEFEKTPGPTKNHFEAQWDFASTVPDAEQPDLSVVASPDRGDGSRMSWVQMADTRNGIDINFYDVRGKSDPAHFVGPLRIASNLDRAVPHTIRITMDFVEGPSNDVVKVYVDGQLKEIGTSWENYYRYDTEAWLAGHGGKTPIVNRIMFRTGGTAAIGNLGKGFLIDNFYMKSADGPTNASQCRNGGWQAYDWFSNQGECMQSANRSN
jgi:hypothetical protein